MGTILTRMLEQVQVRSMVTGMKDFKYVKKLGMLVLISLDQKDNIYGGLIDVQNHHGANMLFSAATWSVIRGHQFTLVGQTNST